jgi:predicted nucleotidyltransferase
LKILHGMASSRTFIYNGTNVFHMEQNMRLDVIALLSRQPSHPRAVAKELHVNHMAAVRVLKLLVEANALDFRTDGRNKVYFLKKTIEARSLVIMAEAQKLSNTVAKHPILRQIISKIQADDRIKLAMLFGSYAKGNPDKNSDIDLYVDTEDLNLREELRELNTRLSVKIGTYDSANNLIKEIENDHVIVKGIEDYLEKASVFK